MGFTNVTFLFFFFPLSIAIYYSILFMDKKIRIISKIRLSDLVIIAFSLLFYAWALTMDAIKFVLYIIIIFLFGKIIEKSKKKWKKLFLIISLVFTLSIVFLYKYLNVFMDTSKYNLIAPIGLSFITFYAISYLVDIYKKDVVKSNIIDTFLYFTFFPKVVSGPIILWKDFKKQIKKREYSTDSFLDGINLLIIGFAKKVVIADSFGVVVSNINSRLYSGIDIISAIGLIILYSLQLYYDFSGYSDIAIGLSKMFGFNFNKNFDYPYISKSITEFWRRWHISLGNWFKEYVYIPLGGNRKGKKRTLCNLLIVFILTGIWHGAGLTYIIWGLFHGVIRVIERTIKDNNIYQKIPNIVKQVLVTILVFFGWEFFLFKDLQSIIDFNKIIFGITRFERIPLTYRYFFDNKIIFLLIIAIVGCFLFNIESVKEKLIIINNNKYGFILKEIALLILLFISIMFMINSEYSPFIYFQY